MDLHARRLMHARARVVFVVALFVAGPIHAQIFSPGPLSKAHAKLEGLANCVKCHEPGNRFSNARCTSCHAEIATRASSSRGLHGQLPASELCATCHREHKGTSARIIDWGAAGKKAFNHARTGTPLKGAHRAADCKACHEPRRLVDKDAKELLDKKGRRETFLGLKNECSACHFDEHRGQLGARCARCHTEEAFKPARRFVHNTMADFKLTGKHRRVRCTKCHTSSVDEKTSTDAFPAPVSPRVTRFEDVAHDRCVDCHRDTHHRGKMGNRCEKCHVTDGWDRLKDLANDLSFHERTRFALRGAHIDVECKACHGPFAGEREPTYRGVPFERCSDCHMDAHLGALVDTQGATPDCRTCHTVERFAPALFTVELHAKTRFALEGSHGAVDCKLCHLPTKGEEARVSNEIAADRRRRDRPIVTSPFPMDVAGDLARCETCHRDPHDGQFDDVMARVGCRSCHQPQSFTNLTFDHDTQSRFPLEGAHARADCRQCHVAAETVVYRGVSSTCADCHRDPHAGQFSPIANGTTTTTNTAGTEPARADCARCHEPAQFTPSRFSHDDARMTAFRLRGRHREVSCAGCHRPVAIREGVTAVQYKGVPTTCAGCHVDLHEGRFNSFVP